MIFSPEVLDMLKWSARESIALVLAGVMFWIYVKDSHTARKELTKMAKSHEELVQKLMDFGIKRGEMEGKIASILGRIEIRLRETTMCPVTAVTNEVLLSAVTEAARRTQPGAVVRAPEIARGLRMFAMGIEDRPEHA